MDRRTFIGASAGASVLPYTVWAAGKARPKVGIVGAGIVGASIAMHLARAGAQVTVFERTAPAAGASGKSMAWINPVVLDAHYRDLRLLSMDRWRALDATLGLGVVWGGSISCALDDARAKNLEARLALLKGTADEGLAIADAQALAQISPALRPGPIKGAFFAPKDGHVEAPVATARFLKDAVRHGAKVVYPCEVTAIDLDQGRVTGVQTSKGPVALDQLISTSGVDTPKVMALAGYTLKLLHSPGLVVHTPPLPPLTKMAYDANGELEFKQTSDGRLITDYAAGPPDLPQHAGIRDHMMDFPSEALMKAHGERILRKTATWMPDVKDAPVEKVMLCFRPMPSDRFPVVGAVPGFQGLYAVVTHSGVTLAPILGQYVSEEIMTGQRMPMLAPYRPERFA